MTNLVCIVNGHTPSPSALIVRDNGMYYSSACRYCNESIIYEPLLEGWILK